MPTPINIRQNKPLLFSPSVVRTIIENDIGTSGFQKTDLESLSSSSLESTSSFRYNTPGEGLRSTQQLNVDWSEFSNHTFFNSAYVKTNVAFRKIFDEFPFDGTQEEFENFIDGLTGFEKWVYDQFPKNKGYLFLSGTQPSEAGDNGTYVRVKDIAGVAYPGVSKDLSGISKLNPELNSMTIEFWIYAPAQSNSGSFILNKIAEPTAGEFHGIGILTPPTASSVSGKIDLGIFSGSANLTADIEILKGQWNHVSFVWDRNFGIHRIFSYLNGDLVNRSSQVELGLLNMNSADLLIGSGSGITVFTPSCTFSGALDELRIWHSIRTQEERDESEKKSIFSQDNLKLYFKFNEISASQTPIVLDHSGQSLHGELSSWAYSKGIRELSTSSLVGPSPMTYEKLENNPVLFPLHPELENLNQDLLDTAAEFDRVNPSRIDRLIPKHYLLQGQDQDGLSTEEGEIIDALSATGATPDTTKLGQTQIILMLLYTWAKFFDEMKLYTQSFSDFMHLDYNPTDTVPDAFLQLLGDQYGIKLPPFFTGSEINQFINAENIDDQISTNSYSLQYIQNQIWRRILLNLQDILKSKGTIHSVKSFIRAVGIDPDNNFRIREFGGPSVKTLSNARETRSEVSTLISFISGGLAASPFLSGAKVEPGFPFPSGSSAGPNDGLYTSGSWTFEGTYRFASTSSLTTNTQSLARMLVTGSSYTNPGKLFCNLLAIENQGLVLYFTPGSGTQGDVILSSSVDIFDGDPWYVSFGFQRADTIYSKVSGSVFLRAAKQSFGEITNVASSSGYVDISATSLNFLTQLNSAENASGSFFQIGNDSTLGVSNSGFQTTNSGSYASKYEGRAGQFRFWSKYLSEIEWREHVRNFKSLGVTDPTTNFNFVTNKSSSWERLRMDVSSDQINLISDSSGSLQFLDFSQNNFNWSGVGFPITSSIIIPQRFQYSLISPKFDLASTTDKVRIRSFQNYENVLSSSYAQVVPVYSIEPSEKPQDNTRFTIDFSIADALDQDIINLFGTLDILDNVIGNPELIFSPDYPGFDILRTVYFNRLTEKINIKSFFEFYKWFDTNIGVFIHQLIPRKTKFLGVNYTIESSMLERPKVEYLFSDIYLGDSVRHSDKNTLLFQQLDSSFNRY